MSEPKDNYENKLNGVMSEIIKAQSSLNMPAKPISVPKDSSGFLTDTDAHVKHAYEHLDMAAKLLNEFLGAKIIINI